jgi:predicted ATPase
MIDEREPPPWMLSRGWRPCRCAMAHRTRLVAITGGPGAGKTGLLDRLRQSLCEHVVVLPESAGILFGGGFPRIATDSARHAAQRAIYRVQAELERIADEDGGVAVALCDRGRPDGLAYWPGLADDFLKDLDTTRQAELSRYAAVIHLRPAPAGKYENGPLRIESAEEAALIDARIEGAWNGHPHRVFVEATDTLDAKVARAIECVRDVLPLCCRVHVGAEVLAGDLNCEP